MKGVIQKALEQDLIYVYKIEQESFLDPWPISIFKEILHHPQQFLYVFKEDERVIGYIVFWKILNEVHILNICAATHKRKQGIGSELLKFCLDFYSKDQVNHFFLEVRRSNKAAQALYYKFGFKLHHVRPKYYSNREDALVMALQY